MTNKYTVCSFSAINDLYILKIFASIQVRLSIQVKKWQTKKRFFLKVPSVDYCIFFSPSNCKHVAFNWCKKRIVFVQYVCSPVDNQTLFEVSPSFGFLILVLCLFWDIWNCLFLHVIYSILFLILTVVQNVLQLNSKLLLWIIY